MNKGIPIKAWAMALIIIATTFLANAQKTDDTQDLYTGNPIVPNIVLEDGHMRVYGDKI